MFGIGVPELAMVLILALIVFGPGKLPEVGKALGKTINNFKRASKEITDDINEEIKSTDDNQKIESKNL